MSSSKQNTLYAGFSTRFGFCWKSNGLLDSTRTYVIPSNWIKFSFLGAKAPSICVNTDKSQKYRHGIVITKCMAEENQGELSDGDDDLCPVECVREFKTDEEFSKLLEKAKETDSLVVVDFYRTSCGSCKYIEQGFSKLCRGSGEQEVPVIFLKHNVIDEYDEQSEVAERLRIKAVPLFHFYKNGVLLESFATRDRQRIDATILKYTSKSSDTSD